MVVVVAADYVQFKDLALLLGQAGSDAVHILARDGVAVGMGFHVLGMNETQQLVVRWMHMQKPATWATDFPKAKYVRDFTVV